MDGETLASWRFVKLNGETYETDDPVQDGRDLLEMAGLKPASEHVLVLVRKNRTHLIGLDDKVDLKAENGAVFRAWRDDRAYAWTLDEIGQIWGAVTIEVDELVGLFSIADDEELVLERETEPDIVLQPGGTISFAEPGTEHIVTRRKRPDAVLVSVSTTAGFFPAEGALRVPLEAVVNEVLKRAAHKLDLKDTDTWVVTCDGRDINPALSFAQNGLTGVVELDWGPREGGGGHA